MAAQQLDLECVHRVDVWVAQRDRAQQHRLAFEQPLHTCRCVHARDRARLLLLENSEQARVADEREIPSRDRQARLRERHLEVVDHRAEERQALIEIAQVRITGRRKRGAAAEPRRQQDAVLRPREHPRDRAQRREIVGVVRTARGTRGDLEQRELIDRRDLAEEQHEALVLPDERAIGRARDVGHALEQRPVGR